MKDKKELIIIGDSAFAQIAYEYFSSNPEYIVVAFSVERAFLRNQTLFGLPVVAFEDLEKVFDPAACKVFVAITYTQLNRVRTRLYKEARRKGFEVVSYISPAAFVWKNVTIGENCFIFENNVIQPFVKIGNNVILWSGNHIGHHSVIHDNVFIASHVVVSGFVEVGENCFLGVNSTIANNVKIAEDCVIGAGSLISRDTDKGTVYKGNVPIISKRTSFEVFNVKEEENEMD